MDVLDDFLNQVVVDYQGVSCNRVVSHLLESKWVV